MIKPKRVIAPTIVFLSLVSFTQALRAQNPRTEFISASSHDLKRNTSRQNTIAAKLETARGLHTVTFETPYGSIIARLPDDMSLGDEIAGTDQRNPAGETQAARAQNLQQLKRYSLDAEGMKSLAVSPTSETLTLHRWSIPAQTTSVALRLKLNDGRILAHIELPPPQPPPVIPCPLRPLPGDYWFPTIGQPGRPIEIHGPFPLDPNAIYARVGNETPTFLASSPRECILESPANVIGPTEIALKIGEVEVRGPFRNMAARLKATKSVLKTNEEAVVSCELSGLEGAQQDIQAQLDTAGAVSMQGGNSQTITVHPSEIQPGGRFSFERTITGNQPGSFQVTVIAQDECGQISNSCQRLATELSRLAYQAKGASQAALAQIGPKFDSLMNAHAYCLKQRSECANSFFKEGDTASPDPCEVLLRTQLQAAQAYLTASAVSGDLSGQLFWKDVIERIQKKLKECEEKKAKQKTEEEGKKKPEESGKRPEAPVTTPPGAPPSGPQTQPSPRPSPTTRPSSTPQPSSTPPPSATPQPATVDCVGECTFKTSVSYTVDASGTVSGFTYRLGKDMDTSTGDCKGDLGSGDGWFRFQRSNDESEVNLTEQNVIELMREGTGGPRGVNVAANSADAPGKIEITSEKSETLTSIDINVAHVTYCQCPDGLVESDIWVRFLYSSKQGEVQHNGATRTQQRVDGNKVVVTWTWTTTTPCKPSSKDRRHYDDLNAWRQTHNQVAEEPDLEGTLKRMENKLRQQDKNLKKEKLVEK